MEFDYITDFLNLKDVFVSKVVHSDSKVSFYIETNPLTHTCSRCGSHTSKDSPTKKVIKNLKT